MELPLAHWSPVISYCCPQLSTLPPTLRSSCNTECKISKIIFSTWPLACLPVHTGLLLFCKYYQLHVAVLQCQAFCCNGIENRVIIVFFFCLGKGQDNARPSSPGYACPKPTLCQNSFWGSQIRASNRI